MIFLLWPLFQTYIFRIATRIVYQSCRVHLLKYRVVWHREYRFEWIFGANKQRTHAHLSFWSMCKLWIGFQKLMYVIYGKSHTMAGLFGIFQKYFSIDAVQNLITISVSKSILNICQASKMDISIKTTEREKTERKTESRYEY